jgi:hypothetical protein
MTCINVEEMVITLIEIEMVLKEIGKLFMNH